MANVAQLAVGIRNDAGPGSRAFVRDVDRVRVGANRATGSVIGMQGAMASAGRTAKGAGASILAAFGVFGGIAVVTMATKAISEFEETMALAGKVSRASGEQFANMSEQAKMLGATTRFTAAEAADGLLFLSRAGFQAEEAMAALPATLNLAAAGVMGLGEAADLASNVVKQFQLAAEDTVRVVDALIIVSNRANTNVSQLGEAMKYAGPVANAVGMSVEQTAAAMGALGDAGIQASLAGTNLRGVLAGLLGPTSKAKSAIEGMGLQMSDVDITQRGLVDVFQSFSDANITAADAVAIFGRRNAAAALVLADSTTKMRELEIATKLNRGEAEQMSDVMNNTLAGSLRALKSAFEGVMLAGGDAGFSGTLKSLVDTATGVLRVFAGMGSSVEKNRGVIFSLAAVIEILVVRFVALKAINLIVFFGNMTRSIYAAAVAARATTGAMGALGAAISAAGGPITILASAIAVTITLFSNSSRAAEEQTQRMQDLKVATDAYSDSLTRVGRQVGFEGRVSAQVQAVEALTNALETAQRASEATLGTRADQAQQYQRYVTALENRGLRGGTFETPGPFRYNMSPEFKQQIQEMGKLFTEVQTDILARFNEIKNSNFSPEREATEMLGLFADVEQVVRSASQAVERDASRMLAKPFREFKATLDEMGLIKTADELNELSRALSSAAESSEGLAKPMRLDVQQAAISDAAAEILRSLKESNDEREVTNTLNQILKAAEIERKDVSDAQVETLRQQIRETLDLVNAESARKQLAERIDAQLGQMNEALTVQNLLSQDMNREAAQMEAVFQAQNAARQLGLSLSESQLTKVMDLAGAQFDLARAMEDARAKELEDLREKEQLEREALRAAEETARARQTSFDALSNSVRDLRLEVGALSVEHERGQAAAAQYLEVQKLNELVANASSNATEEQMQKVRALGEEHAALSQQRDALNAQLKEQQVIAQTERQIAAAFTDMVSSIVTGSETAQDALRNFGQAIMDMVVQQIVAATVTRLFMSTIGGPAAGAIGGTAAGIAAAGANGLVMNGGNVVPFAYGGVIDGPVMSGGNVVPFAYGGVIDGPAYFPMSGGRTGLMGEAGPEAIMPLKRGPDGRLGVEASNGSGAASNNVTINMNVKTADADSFRRSRSQIARQLRAAQSGM